MTTVYNLTELLPCPFCGCAAAYYGAAVRCTSFKCNAGLSPNWSTKAVRSVQGNPDERLRLAQAETAKRWNHRASQAAPAPSDALRDVMAERLRQITAEGWTHCNDDAYQTGDLANAAACYAMTAPMMDRDRTAPAIWPWAASWWKPTNRRRDLIKAGALILAEIERLDRTAAPTEGKA